MNLKQELQDLTSYLHWQHQHVGRCVVEKIVNEAALLVLHKTKSRIRLERKGMKLDRMDNTELDSEL